MSPRSILEDLRKQPFDPIRFYVSDGTYYDIRHPEQCMVGLSDVVIGLAADPSTFMFERMIRVDCRHILKSEPIKTIPTGNNGQQPSA